MIRWFIGVSLLVALATAQGAAASNEPVTSLRIIDQQLSTIHASLEHLQAAGTRAERTRDIRRIRAAVAQIHRRAIRLTSIYRARHQRFGVKMFGELERRCAALARTVTQFERARTKVERERLHDQLSKATLPLVLQYQAIAGNIAANHCQPRQWACCDPKANPETNRGPAQGCRWTCVSKPRACGGFTGPRTPTGMTSAP